MPNSDLKKAGLKSTLPRMKVLEMLENNPESHMGAEEVYQALREAGDEVSLATIYRVLTQFEAAGLVIRHNFEGGRAVFEIDSGGHHDHLVCVSCGDVVEFVDNTIEKRQLRIAEEHGFEIADHSLVIYGRCSKPGCAKPGS